MNVLALETSTDWCSVALQWRGERLAREAAAERGHGGQVLTLVQELLSEAEVSLSALDVIAFGRGPGAFTGVRLAASITQGLAYSVGLPVIAVSDLRAVAQQVALSVAAGAGASQSTRVLVCLDARMGEVYWAGYELSAGVAHAVTHEAVARPTNMRDAAANWLTAAGDSAVAKGDLAVAGSGFAAYAELGDLMARAGRVFADLRPRAIEVVVLAQHEGLKSALPPEQALPVYVRDNVAVVPGG